MDAVRRITAAVSTVLLAAFLLRAAPQTAEAARPLTVEEAVAMGLSYSKGLKATVAKAEGAEAKASENDSLRLPSLRLGGTYTRLSPVPPFEIDLSFLGLGTFIVNPSLPNSYNVQLTLQQPLFTGFQLKGLSDLGHLQAKAAREDVRRDEAEVAFSVRTAYWTVYKTKELKRLVDENVVLVEAHLRDVQNFYDQGLASLNDVLKVKVLLASVQSVQLQAGNGITLSTMALNSLIGLPVGTEIGILSSVNGPAAEPSPLSALIDRALERRPELRSLGFQVQAAQAGVKVANSGRYPQLFLVGNFYTQRPNQRILPVEDRFKSTWDLSLALSFDLWNWNRTKNQARQAKSVLAQAEDGAAQLKDGIVLEVSQNYFALEQQKMAIKLAAETVAQAEENYRVTGNRFKAGLALNSDLLDAEVALLQAKITHSQALADSEVLRAKLAKSVDSERR